MRARQCFRLRSTSESVDHVLGRNRQRALQRRQTIDRVFGALYKGCYVANSSLRALVA